MLSDGVRQLMEVRAASALGMSASLRTASCSLRNRNTTRWWQPPRCGGGVYIATLIWNGVRPEDQARTTYGSAGTAFHTSSTTRPCCLHGSSSSWRKIEFVKKLETVVPYLVGVPKRNGKLSTETFCPTDEFSMDTLIAHIKRTAARVESGDPPRQSVRRSGHAAGAQRQDALQIRQRELAHG
jgi:hypothetical protein